MNLQEQGTENENPMKEQEVTDSSTPLPKETIEEATSSTLLAEDDDHEDLETEEYTGFEKAQLIKKLKELISIEDTDHTHQIVRKIKEAFEQLHPKETENTLGEENEEAVIKTIDAEDETFMSLLKTFKQKREKQKKEKEKNYQENLTLKKAIIEELKTLPEKSHNISSAFEKFHELQSRWRTIGPVPAAHVMDTRESYQFFIQKFFDGLKINKELRDLDLKKNLELKNEIISKAENLIQEPSIRKALESYKHLSEQWRDIGYIGKESNETLWEKFKAAGESIYQRRKTHLGELEKKQEENLIGKNQIFEKMEALSNAEHTRHKHWQDATEKVNALMDEWTKIGRVPKAHNNEIWKKFRALRQGFFASRENYYESIRQEQKQNLEQKMALCVQAEGLISSTQWKEGSEQLKKLQEQWKAIGPVPFKISEKIWKRFRKACDGFFENKNAFYAKVDEQKIANSKIREALIEKTKSFTFGEDERDNYDQLRLLREEWKNAGEAPIKEKEALNNAFRKAMDEHMATLKGKSGNSEMFQQVRMEELKHSEKGRDQLQKEKNDLQLRIKKLQADVALLENNLGFFGHSKNAEKMKEEYLQKVEEGKKEIKRLHDKVKMMGQI